MSATVERLGSILRERQELAGEHFDLTEAIAREVELLELVRRMERDLDTGASGPYMDLSIVAILRPLHRVLYTLLGPYHPDPAVSEGSLPGFNAVEMLATNDPSTDRYQFVRTTLRRELARILEALDTAFEGAESLVGGAPGR